MADATADLRKSMRRTPVSETGCLGYGDYCAHTIWDHLTREDKKSKCSRFDLCLSNRKVLADSILSFADQSEGLLLCGVSHVLGPHVHPAIGRFLAAQVYDYDSDMRANTFPSTLHC